jgi:four helix bundle protein
MNKEELERRSQSFAVNIRRACAHLEQIPSLRSATQQLIRSTASVGANYRSACRGRSRAEFVAKLGVAAEEADESVYWLEYLLQSLDERSDTLVMHLAEAKQLRAILASSYKTSRANLHRQKSHNRP